MKKFFVFLITLLLVGCKCDMKIISSIKQKVIPGIQTAKPFTNYIFKVEIKSDLDITIDRVLVIENKQCFQPKLLIKKEKSASYIDKINSKGIYFFEVSLKDRNYSKVNNCDPNGSKDKVIVYYSVNNQQKKFEINSFVYKEIRKR